MSDRHFIKMETELRFNPGDVFSSGSCDLSGGTLRKSAHFHPHRPLGCLFASLLLFWDWNTSWMLLAMLLHGIRYLNRTFLSHCSTSDQHLNAVLIWATLRMRIRITDINSLVFGAVKSLVHRLWVVQTRSPHSEALHVLVFINRDLCKSR